MVLFLASGFSYIAFAIPPGTTYSPGETLDPICAPGDPNCTVSITPSGSNGYIQFSTSGALASDAGLFWENTNKRLGIGTTTPSYKLDIIGDANISAGSAYKLNGSNMAIASTTLNNYFFGGAGNLTMTGIDNTGTGYLALSNNTSGSYNTALGRESLYTSTSTSWNTAVGYRSLYSNTIGYANTAVGREALYSNTTGTGNTANGSRSLYSNTTGSSNTATGLQSLQSNTTGSSNTANGFASLFLNTTGLGNVALGRTSLYSNTTGSYNTANGVSSLYSNTTGSFNTALGYQSLYTSTSTSWNTAVGYESLYSNTTGNQNTANGYHSMYSNTTGDNNTASGRYSLYSNTTGYVNTANGDSSLYFNTTGFANTASGYNSLYSNTTGTYNTANGTSALRSNTTGWANTASGNNALFSNTTGASSTATGYRSLQYNTTGSGNTANGSDALYSNTTGSSNTAIGYQSLYTATSAGYNTAVGHQSLYSNTTGLSNTASGVDSLYSNTTGIYNTANGLSALRANTTGSQNTASGLNALRFNTTGTSSTAVGYQAGQSNITGNQNTFLGMAAGFTDGSITTPADLVNSTAIGYNAQVTASSSLVLGGTGAYAVKVGVGTASPSQTFHVEQSRTGVVARFVNGTGYCDINPTTTALVCTSDAALKKDIETVGSALGTISALRGVTFRWLNEDGSTPKHLGFIAQEVEKVLPELVATDIASGKKSVNYIGFTPVLIEAVKEIASRLYALEERVSQIVASGVSSGINDIRDFVVETLTAKKVITDTLEMKDSVTNEVYCVKISNGEWDKSKGVCGGVSANNQMASVILAEDLIDDTATSTQDTDVIASSTVDIIEEESIAVDTVTIPSEINTEEVAENTDTVPESTVSETIE